MYIDAYFLEFGEQHTENELVEARVWHELVYKKPLVAFEAKTEESH